MLLFSLMLEKIKSREVSFLSSYCAMLLLVFTGHLVFTSFLFWVDAMAVRKS